MKEDDDIESKPFMSTAYNKFIAKVQAIKVTEDDQPIERLRKVHEVFKMKPQQTNLFREQGKSCITPPTTTFKKEESLVTKRNFPCH